MSRVLAVKIYEYLLRTGEEGTYINHEGRYITREDCTRAIWDNMYTQKDKRATV